MRPVSEIIVHCTATRPEWWAGKSLGQKVAEIRRWHVSERGWKDIGYHFLIDRDGKVMPGRPLEREGAHVMGHNSGTIGIALFGGHGSASTDRFADHFTPEQDSALRAVIAGLQQRFPAIRTVSGHNDYAAKACPGFAVASWLAQVAPPRPPAPPPDAARPDPVPEPPSGGFFMRLWRALSGGF